ALGLTAVRGILEGEHNQPDVLAGRVPQRHHDGELRYGIVTMPARVEDGNALDGHVNVVGGVAVPDAVRERAREHRVHLVHAGRRSVQSDTDQLGVGRHDLVAQLLAVNLVVRGGPVLRLWPGRCLSGRLRGCAERKTEQQRRDTQGFCCLHDLLLRIARLVNDLKRAYRSLSRSAFTMAAVSGRKIPSLTTASWPSLLKM